MPMRDAYIPEGRDGAGISELLASCTHTASDVFVIPKAGRSAPG